MDAARYDARRMRRLLALYPGSLAQRRAQMRRLAPWLRARGIEVTLADDWVEAEDAECFSHVVQVPPPTEVGAVVAALATHECDAILVQSEAAALSGALLCAERALPGASPTAALTCAGKHLTRAALAAHGVAQPEFALVEDARGVRAFAAGAFPVVLKAVASAMSRLVTLVRSDADVDAAVALVRAGLLCSPDVARLVAFGRASDLDLHLDPTRTFLVERFAAGDPVEVDGIAVGAVPHPYGVIGQRMTPPPLFYIEAYLLPAGRTDEARILATAGAAVEAVGLRDAGYAVELRATSAGPRVVEVNGRLGEDDGYGELFAAAVGADPVRHAIAVAFGERPDPVSPPRGFHVLAYRNWLAGGRVAEVPDSHVLRSASLRTGLSVSVGTELRAAPHPETYPHLAWALAHDVADPGIAYEHARAALATLPFVVS